MFIPRFVACVLAAAVTFPALAGVVDEAVKLAAGGVAADVQLAWANRQKNFELSARDIIALKDAQVPDDVVMVLVRNSASSSMAEAREVAPRETARYVERELAQPTTYVSTPTTYVATPASYVYYDYYPRYRYYSYPRYYSSYYYRPYRYHSYPRYYYRYPRYYGGYYGGWGRHRHHRHHGHVGFGFSF
jgi:hypothetical protein